MKKKTLGIYGGGSMPKIHIDRGNGTSLCGSKSKALAKDLKKAKGIEVDPFFICELCLKFSKESKETT